MTQQILNAIADVQKTMLELRDLATDNSRRLDRLEHRQFKFERTMLQQFGEVQKRLNTLESGQNTSKGQMSNMLHTIDTIYDYQEVLGEGYLRQKNTIERIQQDLSKDKP